LIFSTTFAAKMLVWRSRGQRSDVNTPEPNRKWLDKIFCK